MSNHGRHINCKRLWELPWNHFFCSIVIVDMDIGLHCFVLQAGEGSSLCPALRPVHPGYHRFFFVPGTRTLASLYTGFPVGRERFLALAMTSRDGISRMQEDSWLNSGIAHNLWLTFICCTWHGPKYFINKHGQCNPKMTFQTRLYKNQFK